MRVPVPLRADAYTIASDCLVSQNAKDGSIYNFTNRISPAKAWPEIAKDSRMVFWGLSRYIADELSDPCTGEDIAESVEFMNRAHSFGGPLSFNPKIWERVLNEYNGFLPITIEAPPEGSTFFPFEPVIQVTGTNGFGEIAAHIEAIMVGRVSINIARATLTRHILERMNEWAAKDYPDVADTYAIAQWMIHDFGMRASSNATESEDLGLAHLLSFHGTDTFNAAYLAYKMGGKVCTGTSILALAHRIVQGYDAEIDCFKNLYNQTLEEKNGIASYVSDCYNFKKAVREHLVNICKADGPTVVVRPDSGDFLQNDFLVLQTAVEQGLFKKDASGRYIPTNMKIIQGDSMTPNKIDLLFKNREFRGFAPTMWGIIGIGGYLRNNCTRDTLSSAYKLSAIRSENKWRPVVKLSETKGKLSVPGPNKVYRYDNHYRPTVYLESEFQPLGRQILQTYYNNGVVKDLELFSVIQDRTISDFNDLALQARHIDVKGCLSDNIRNIQESFYNEHQSI